MGIGDQAKSVWSIRFAVLGSVRVWRDGLEVELGPRQRQLILALLLARVNTVVTVSDIVELLWRGDPPASAFTIVQRHIGVLRRLMDPGLPSRESGDRLLFRSTGYVLIGAGAEVDLLEFRELRWQAEQFAGEGYAEEAIDRYVCALKLRSGACGAGLDVTHVHPAFVAVDNEASAVARSAADLAFAATRPGLVLACLRQAAKLDPFDEGLQARLLLCLAQDGHRAEALQLYPELRRRLSDELGVEPGAELVRAHRRILAPGHDGQAVKAAPKSAANPSASPAVPAVMRPAQLPADLPMFTGRISELEQMDKLAAEALGNGTSPTISIDGMPGVGKTALAVHWAHRVAPRFPDGQLYLNLRGFDMHGECLQPREAMHSLLLSVGVAVQEIPADQNACVGLYRSVLSGRRALIVLDNARDVEQVGELIPGSPGCLVLITSRNRMTGLAVLGAALLPLTVPNAADAEAALATRIGHLRAMTQGADLGEIVIACGRLPLALAVVAARAASSPEFSLSAIAGQLRSSPNRLDAFGADDLHSDIRAVFSWSYRLLSQAAARMFRLLSLPNGPDISIDAAASLAGIPVRQALAVLGELTKARLLIEDRPNRFSFHDLLRVYSYELVSETDGPDDRHDAQARLFDFYRHAAHAANHRLNPRTLPMGPPEARPGVVSLPPPDDVTAYAWFDAEHGSITALLTLAATEDLPGPAWPLALSMQHYFHRSWNLGEWTNCAKAALTAAERSGDELGQAHAHRCLAGAELNLEHLDAAEAHLNHAEALCAGPNRFVELAHVHSSRGILYRAAERFDLAIKYGQLALEMYRAAENPAGLAHQEFTLAVALAESGDLAGALPRLEKAVNLYQHLGDRYGELAARSGVGEISFLTGDHETALSCWTELLAQRRAAGRPTNELAHELELIGKAHLAGGDVISAGAYLTEALEINEHLGRLSVVQRVRDRLDQAAVLALDDQ